MKFREIVNEGNDKKYRWIIREDKTADVICKGPVHGFHYEEEAWDHMCKCISTLRKSFWHWSICITFLLIGGVLGFFINIWFTN